MKNFKYWWKRNFHKFSRKPIKKVFNSIYDDNHWDGSESISGKGSDTVQTETIIEELPVLFRKFNIKSILDIPSGDFFWMKNIDFSEMQYFGGDIVAPIVESNNKNYSSDNIQFLELDLTIDDLPKVDAIFTRDCLVHFSYSDIKKAISNIINSGSKYLITTSFAERQDNYDITTGDWRPINLLEKPFNFPTPIASIVENCTEDNGVYADKSLLVWEVKQITDLDFLVN